jgi:HEAT repeat protein
VEQFLNLFSDLHSPDPALRLSVLWRIEGIEWNPERIRILRDHVARETDPGVRFHLQKILARIEAGGKTPATTENFRSELEKVLNTEPRDELSLALLLETGSSQEAPLVAMLLRDAGWPDFSQEVLPFVLRFLKRFGSFEDVGPIEELCRHPNPRILTAAVEALEKLHPESLKPLIVPLLAGPSHGIRIRAVKLLFRWDAAEALHHFETMLFSSDPAEQRAAVSNSIFLPFADISEALLRFIAGQEDLTVLRDSGMLLCMNPALDLLLPLTAILETSAGEKRTIVAEILTGVIRSLSGAGIVAKSPEEILNDLKGEYKKTRRSRESVISTISDGPAAPAVPAPPDRSLASYSVAAVRRLREARAAGLSEPGIDPILAIYESLAAPEASTHLNQVARIEAISWTPERVTALNRLLEAEPPSDLRERLIAVRNRILPAGQGPSLEVLVGDTLKFITSSPRPDFALALALGKIPATGAGNILDGLSKVDWKAFSPGLLPFLLRFVKTHGNRTQAEAIRPFCAHTDSKVAGAAVEALEKLAPDLLKDSLLPLFLHPLPQIRSKAVVLLHRWEPHLALRHFESMLFSPAKSERAAALTQAFFFPFGDIEHLLLRFLAMEESSDLLEAAGCLFQANPSLEAAELLFECLEGCREQKQKLLTPIFQGMLTDLHRSGLVRGDLGEIQAEIQTACRRRRTDHLLCRCEIALKSGSEAQRRQAIQELSGLSRAGIEAARDMLAAVLPPQPPPERPFEPSPEHSSEPTPELPPPIATGLPLPESQRLNHLSPEIRVRFLRHLSREQLLCWRPQFPEFLGEATHPEKMALLQSLGECGTREDASFLYPFLREENAELQEAALTSLEKLDPEYLFPYLPRLIKHSAPGVRFAALRIFARFDKKQTLSLLEKMISVPNPQERLQALTCAGQLDFPSVRPFLLKSLGTETETEVLDQIAVFFQDAAERETCIELLRIRRSVPAERVSRIEDMIRRTANNLVQRKRSRHHDSDHLIAELQQEIEAAEEGLSAASPFSVAGINHLRRQAKPAPPPPREPLSLRTWAIRGAIFLILVGVSTAGVRQFHFSSNPSSVSPPSLPVNPSGFDPTPRDLHGLIAAIEPDQRGLYIQSPSEPGVEFHVFLETPGEPQWRKGDEFHGHILPERKIIRTIRARLLKRY